MRASSGMVGSSSSGGFFAFFYGCPGFCQVVFELLADCSAQDLAHTELFLVEGDSAWVELFGSGQLGLIRGVYTALMVISTAVSPALLGALLSGGWSLTAIFMPAVAYAVVVPWLLAPMARSA